MKNPVEKPAGLGLVEKYNFTGIKLKTEPNANTAFYVVGLLDRISKALPNPDFETIFSNARKEVEASRDRDPMTPVTMSILNEAIEFIKENLIIEPA